MPDRKSLLSTLWFISSLALLASVLVAPIRTPKSAMVSFRPNFLHLALSLPPGQLATELGAAIPTDSTTQLNALASDNEVNEEQDRAVVSDELRVSFLIPCSFCKVHDRQLIAPRLILSFYPLRC